VVPRRRTTGTQGQLFQGTTVRVNGNQQWTPTNITVHQGERLTFQVSGQIKPIGNGAFVGPEGGSGKSPNFPLADANIGALIGRVGDGQPFAITGVGDVVMAADGQLFLGINDDNVSDNSGAFTVRVSPASNAVGTTGTLPFGQGNTIAVDATRPWTPTGITVQQGEQLTFAVSGTISWWHGAAGETTGNGGALDPKLQNEYPVPSAGVGALIGRVNGHAFMIGRSGQPITMPASGQLFLGINDREFDDNSGAYTVSIQVAGR
jgi:hypothetical protein